MQELNLTDRCLNENSNPYDIFIFAINSQVTKQKYTYRLSKFFNFINGNTSIEYVQINR